VFLDELTRNPTGKVLKRELAEEGEDDDEAKQSNGKASSSKKEKKSGAKA